MNIAYRVSWPATPGATRYKLSSMDASGNESTLSDSITDTYYDTTIDDTVDNVFMVRAFTGTYYGNARTIVYNAPITLASLRNAVRVALKDTGNTQKWANSELNQYIHDGISEYAQYFPVSSELAFALTADQTTYQLPDDALEVKRVQYIDSAGNKLFLKRRGYKPGQADYADPLGYWKLGVLRNGTANRFYAGHYDYANGTLQLDFKPKGTDSLRVYYKASRVLPPNDYVRLDIPKQDEQLIVLFACWKAVLRIQHQDTQLSRWKESGKRDDSPIEVMATDYLNAYKYLLNKRLNQPRFMTRTRV